MRKYYILFLMLTSGIKLLGQTVNFYQETLTKADRCFKRLDFKCAKTFYHQALAYHRNDPYCLKQLKVCEDKLHHISLSSLRPSVIQAKKPPLSSVTLIKAILQRRPYSSDYPVFNEDLKQAILSFNSGQYDQALPLLTKMIYLKGDVESKIAKNYLGILYYKGWGVDIDYTKAKDLFLQAGYGGPTDKLADDEYARFNLGTMYFNGDGVKQNYNQAMKYYHDAVDLGNTYAQFMLGYMYENGLGVPKNLKYAIFWYQADRSRDSKNRLKSLGVSESQ